MNSSLKLDFEPNGSRRHQWQFRKKFKFGLNHSKRKKSWKVSKGSEYFPLMSDDMSDDEIVVHDSSILKLRQRNSPKSSVRSEPTDTSTNGDVVRRPVSDPFRNCELITVKLKKEDTLQSISLKYRCPISEIKRANNLISDQDFYALPQVKIPVRKHGVLSQVMYHRELSTGEESNDGGDNKNDEVRVINLGLMMSNDTPQEAAAFLKRMDEDLVRIVLNTKTQKDSLEEAAAALSAPAIQPLGKDPYGPVECTIQWSYVLFFLLLISVVLPVIIIVYMYYLRTPHNAHHNQTFSDSTSPESFSSVQKTSVLGKS